MSVESLKKVLVIEVKLAKATPNGVEFYWNETTIKRVSDSFVWFNGMGLQRVGKTTFINNTEQYRIKQ